MSKLDDNRQFERDYKYFRKVLGQVDDGIKLPHSLTPEILVSRLDGVDTISKPHIAISALSFLRSKVFSLQSVVSYAIAFVLIVAVAYGMRSGNERIIDGNMILQQPAPSGAASLETAGTAVSEDKTAADSGMDAYSPKITPDETGSAPNDNLTKGHAPAEAPSDSEAAGVGGGGKSVQIGQDDKYIYMCRYNDLTDPDKADFPVTIELIGSASNESAGFINIPDIDSVIELYTPGEAICLVGLSGENVVSRVYGIQGAESGVESAEITALSQPGTYSASRLFNGILHVVTLDETDSDSDIDIVPLPGAASEVKCFITAVDTASGKSAQRAYAGVDKGVSLHDHNMYMSYSTLPDEDGQTDLNMAQIPLAGLSLEMVMVP